MAEQIQAAILYKLFHSIRLFIYFVVIIICVLNFMSAPLYRVFLNQMICASYVYIVASAHPHLSKKRN